MASVAGSGACPVGQRVAVLLGTKLVLGWIKGLTLVMAKAIFAAAAMIWLVRLRANRPGKLVTIELRWSFPSVWIMTASMLVRARLSVGAGTSWQKKRRCRATGSLRYHNEPVANDG